MYGFIVQLKVYPRIHGGNESKYPNEQIRGGLSPHSRGKHEMIDGIRQNNGSIPAFTGETVWVKGYACRNRVYPRIHGGNMK